MRPGRIGEVRPGLRMGAGGGVHGMGERRLGAVALEYEDTGLGHLSVGVLGTSPSQTAPLCLGRLQAPRLSK